MAQGLSTGDAATEWLPSADEPRGRSRDPDADAEFRRLAGRVSTQESVWVTPRWLMGLVGARRRGSRFVAEIRSRLARHHLETQPDFVDAGADSQIQVVPTTDHQSPFVETLQEANRRLDTGETPLQLSVRTMVEWIGAERRGAWVSERIRATLAGFELETRPDFESVHIDAQVALVRRGAVSGDAEPAAERGHDAPTEPASAPVEPASDTTFRIGTLAEANREIVRVSPQTTLREAMSVMLVRRVSHLPIMANDRRVTGVLRWKDIGKFLLLSTGASLDQPVEHAAAPPVIVHINDPFLDSIPHIIQHGCVLVRDDHNKVCGIVTTKDLGRRLHDLAAPFVTLGEIERCLRTLMERGDFTADELRELARNPGDARPVESVADLTLGEAVRLLERQVAWDRVGVALDRGAFVERLGAVRKVRNGVMHFEPDTPTARDREELSKFLALMYELRRHADD